MKLSIITINYNDAKGLEKTLHSIIPHKVEGMELIVIDGGSSDMSIDVINHHKSSIDYFESKSDKGIYNAMNKGIAKAKGKYVMFVNSGDDLMPTVDFGKLIERTSSDIDIIYHNLQIVEENRSYIKTYPNKLDFKYFVEDSLPHTGTLIKKELMEKHGLYNENLKIVSDWAFFMDCILLHNSTYTYYNECFASFYFGGISSLPQNFSILMAEREEHIAKQYPLYNSVYEDWRKKGEELYKLKSSKSVKILKKLGFLKWLKL